MVDGGAVDWFPLHKLLALAEPTSNAKYVASKRFMHRNRCQASRTALSAAAEISLCRRIASRRSNASAHTMTVGVYGKALPPQNGAPVRRLCRGNMALKGLNRSSVLSWPRASANHLESGSAWRIRFLRNVNPHVDHPRWSQATERFIVQAASSMYSASQRYCLMVTPAGGIAVSWPGFAGEFLNASEAKQVTWLKVCLHLAGLLPFPGWSGRLITVDWVPIRWKIFAFYWSHCTEIFAGDLVNHTSARYAKQPLLIRTRRLLGLWSLPGRHCI